MPYIAARCVRQSVAPRSLGNVTRTGGGSVGPGSRCVTAATIGSCGGAFGPRAGPVLAGATLGSTPAASGTMFGTGSGRLDGTRVGGRRRPLVPAGPRTRHGGGGGVSNRIAILWRCSRSDRWTIVPTRGGRARGMAWAHSLSLSLSLSSSRSDKSDPKRCRTIFRGVVIAIACHWSDGRDLCSAWAVW